MKNVIVRGYLTKGKSHIKVLLFWRGQWEVWHSFSAPSNSKELKQFLRGLDYELNELSRH